MDAQPVSSSPRHEQDLESVKGSQSEHPSDGGLLKKTQTRVLPGFNISTVGKRIIKSPPKYSIMDGLMQVQNQLASGFADQTEVLHEVDEEGDENESNVAELPKFSHASGDLPHKYRHKKVNGRFHRGSPSPSQIEVLAPSSRASSNNPSMTDVATQINHGDPSSPPSQKHTIWPVSNKKPPKRVKYRRKHSISGSSKAPQDLGVTAMHSDLMLRNPMLVRPSQTTTKTTPTVTSTAANQNMTLEGARQKMILQLDPERSFDTATVTPAATMQSLSLAKPQQHAEVLIENQRGWLFLGFPFFSANMLVPSDPAEWTCGASGLATAPGDISSYPLPTPSWEWSWRRWYIDMAYDVDDQGWSYSWSFGSKTWHGSHVWFHSFVRRRRWIRLRQLKGIETAVFQTKVPEFNSSHESEDYLAYAKSSYEAARYGSNYFVLPPKGRIESSLASIDGQSRRESMSGASIASSSQTQLQQQLQFLHQKRAGNTPAASMRALSQFSDRASAMSFLAEHRDFSSLLADLQGARLDRERLDLLTAFVRNARGNIDTAPQSSSTPQDKIHTPQAVSALAELRTIANDPHLIQAILQTFSFLDSKRHLVDHLKGILENPNSTKHVFSDSQHDLSNDDIQDAASNSPIPEEPPSDKPIEKTALSDTNTINKNPSTASGSTNNSKTEHEKEFVRVLQGLITSCTEIIQQNQYYTD